MKPKSCSVEYRFTFNYNHGIIKTGKDLRTPSPVPTHLYHAHCPCATSPQFLNTSRDGDSITSLGRFTLLQQCRELSPILFTFCPEQPPYTLLSMNFFFPALRISPVWNFPAQEISKVFTEENIFKAQPLHVCFQSDARWASSQTSFPASLH